MSPRASTHEATRPDKAVTGLPLQRAAITGTRAGDTAPPIVDDVLRSPGRPLDATTRAFMEPRFGHDFSSVRVHDDARAAASARAVGALAYTAGRHVTFGTGRFDPATSEGRALLAHELAHVAQQETSVPPSSTVSPADGPPEETADRVARDIGRGKAVRVFSSGAPTGLQRKVAFHDVGRNERSGYARLPELIARLNAMRGGLTYSLAGNELAYERKEGQELSAFDRQMAEFVDSETTVPMRLTNRHGLLRDAAGAFRRHVQVDEWHPGYVDVDDLLASSDLGLQFVLVHFIRERMATRHYARRIGSPSMTQSDFDRAHGQGIEAETRLLREFFGDPTIRFVLNTGPPVFRVFRNDAGDRFRARMRARGGVEAVSVEVRTHDGRVLGPEEYLELRRAEQTHAQVERERLGGATEHRAGGVNVPSP